MERLIGVYSDWSERETARRLGTLRVRPGRTRELFDFTFDDGVLIDAALARQRLDPDIGLFRAPQFPGADRSMFGMFKDSSPDRWGETLIRRRFERAKRAGRVTANARLVSSQ